MNKQEAIEKIEKEKSPFNSWEDLNRNNALDDALDIVEKLDEPEKPVVPQFVAEWIEKTKKIYNLYGAMGHIKDNSAPSEIMKWFSTNPTLTGEILARAWLDGYEVEKEKLYTVEIPNPNGDGYGRVYLGRNEDNKIELRIWNNFSSIEFSNDWKRFDNAQLTEDEIKKDYEWAWQFAKEVE